ncbi:bifunctional diaminohydroxyphosphoribosylaminopyrimidine deaminase/5-amino-6-(5-phosphoribosylamino)uracil reductase RibD [Candidatus Methylopumilus rimovensis]|uniref:Riboflavin biosynthesis protein RibD n=2 Tax=Candidatus Methylopumilus rimovensis TaxID=2588535 RepID=A0AAE6FTC1_9PROT|nr:bifunctional diaminohydroxyphosphoribosylaminopyrimidine deaminase/5-amino-6-(5-phosphoribosylamino)uracil reductase RibD [Candidatus Methylopumilus rimovensis]QDD13629.1 bifunctional diaminohydroxyphosphoribosylaminopyrimidine deaminase/5-amino-6-(5-phosphoribosylamino)uracil reductase RibD [Candidatus Methylopumilus rimovensis]
MNSYSPQFFMSEALRLAEKALFTTSPNPRVGCVIVQNNEIVGRGYHMKAGESHAEVMALEEAGNRSEGSDVYVTLEPCSHTGRTPPCVNALIKAKVKKVFIAMQDPNPLVSGQGIQKLKEAYIDVEVGVMEAQAQQLNIGFICRMTKKSPYVRAKLAVSIDGKTALHNGKSQWITGEAARADVQYWRASSCAILTGIGTVLSDNPKLSVRLYENARQPLRVVVDSELKIPLDADILHEKPLLIVYANDKQKKLAQLEALGIECIQLDDRGKVDLAALIKILAEREMNEVWIEAGEGLNGAFLKANLIDELMIYYAPVILGSEAKGMFTLPAYENLENKITTTLIDHRWVGQDLRMRFKLK